MTDEETPLEQQRRLRDEFIAETKDVHPVGEVAEDGKYGHPFHDRVAAYIKNNQAKLQQSFREGFAGRQQERALEYLRGMGIITKDTPTARVNEFLAAWGIPPLPDQETTTVDVGEVTMVSPNLDDEVVDAEIVGEE